MDKQMDRRTAPHHAHPPTFDPRNHDSHLPVFCVSHLSLVPCLAWRCSSSICRASTSLVLTSTTPSTIIQTSLTTTLLQLQCPFSPRDYAALKYSRRHCRLLVLARSIST